MQPPSTRKPVAGTLNLLFYWYLIVNRKRILVNRVRTCFYHQVSCFYCHRGIPYSPGPRGVIIRISPVDIGEAG
jgi:hypothetical protein